MRCPKSSQARFQAMEVRCTGDPSRASLADSRRSAGRGRLAMMAGRLVLAAGLLYLVKLGFPWPSQTVAAGGARPVVHAPGPEHASVVSEPSVDRCTPEDLSIIDAAGGGHEEGSWTKMNADCGSASWGIFGGMDTAKYKACILAKRPITERCATCFSDSGRYGFDHCKLPCLMSWCSTSCLQCSDHNMENVDRCAGQQVPRATVCDDS